MKQRATLSPLPPPPTLSEMAAASMPAVTGDQRGAVAELQRLFPPERLLAASDDLFSYECDAQTFDRAAPLAVVFPETTAEVAAVVRACVERQVPFVPRGAGTGLSGGAVAVGSVLISTARLDPIPQIDVGNPTAL